MDRPCLPETHLADSHLMNQPEACERDAEGKVWCYSCQHVDRVTRVERRTSNWSEEEQTRNGVDSSPNILPWGSFEANQPEPYHNESGQSHYCDRVFAKRPSNSVKELDP